MIRPENMPKKSERLTARDADGHAYYPACLGEPCNGGGCPIGAHCEFEERVCEKLAEYEESSEAVSGSWDLLEGAISIISEDVQSFIGFARVLEMMVKEDSAKAEIKARRERAEKALATWNDILRD